MDTDVLYTAVFPLYRIQANFPLVCNSGLIKGRWTVVKYFMYGSSPEELMS